MENCKIKGFVETLMGEISPNVMESFEIEYEDGKKNFIEEFLLLYCEKNYLEETSSFGVYYSKDWKIAFLSFPISKFYINKTFLHMFDKIKFLFDVDGDGHDMSSITLKEEYQTQFLELQKETV